MSKSASSFLRKSSRLKPQATVLIICEDKKSCRTYLQDAAVFYRSNALVDIAHCGNTDPMGIIRAAMIRKKKYEAVYCAIDRDSHHNFDEAINLSKEHGITMFVSYPCYEFWLLLHFRENRRPYAASGTNSSCDNLINDLRKEPDMGTYAKGVAKDLFGSLHGRLDDAKKRSTNILKQAEADNNFNPSTTLHTLIDLLEELGKVKE